MGEEGEDQGAAREGVMAHGGATDTSGVRLDIHVNLRSMLLKMDWGFVDYTSNGVSVE